MNDLGNILSYDDICGKYNVSCSPKIYDKMIKYIPLQMINGTSKIFNNNSQNADLMIEHFNFTDKKCSNWCLRNCLLQRCFLGSVKRSYIFCHFDKKKVSEIRTNFLTFPVNPKRKKVHFKIMNHIYPAKYFLRVKFDVGDSNKCQLCNLEIETVEHLFFQCNLVQTFWNDAFCWIHQRLPVRLILSWEIVKFGLLFNDKKVSYVINNLLLLLQFYIHKCTFCIFLSCILCTECEWKWSVISVNICKPPCYECLSVIVQSNTKKRKIELEQYLGDDWWRFTSPQVQTRPHIEKLSWFTSREIDKQIVLAAYTLPRCIQTCIDKEKLCLLYTQRYVIKTIQVLT